MAQSSDGLIMTQYKYIQDLPEETKFLQSHTNDIQIEVNYKLTIREDDPRIEICSY